MKTFKSLFKSLYYSVGLVLFCMTLMSSETSQSQGANTAHETPGLESIKAPQEPQGGRQGPVLDPLKSRTLRRLKLLC